MRYDIGWHFSGRNAVYLCEPSEDLSGLVVHLGSEDIVVYASPSLDNATCVNYKTKTMFIDWTEPTEAERVMFEVELGYPYAPKEMLDAL